MIALIALIKNTTKTNQYEHKKIEILVDLTKGAKGRKHDEKSWREKNLIKKSVEKVVKSHYKVSQNLTSLFCKG